MTISNTDSKVLCFFNWMIFPSTDMYTSSMEEFFPVFNLKTKRRIYLHPFKSYTGVPELWPHPVDEQQHNVKRKTGHFISSDHTSIFSKVWLRWNSTSLSYPEIITISSEGVFAESSVSTDFKGRLWDNGEVFDFLCCGFFMNLGTRKAIESFIPIKFLKMSRCDRFLPRHIEREVIFQVAIVEWVNDYFHQLSSS